MNALRSNCTFHNADNLCSDLWPALLSVDDQIRYKLFALRCGQTTWPRLCDIWCTQMRPFGQDDCVCDTLRQLNRLVNMPHMRLTKQHLPIVPLITNGHGNSQFSIFEGVACVDSQLYTHLKSLPNFGFTRLVRCCQDGDSEQPTLGFKTALHSWCFFLHWFVLVFHWWKWWRLWSFFLVTRFLTTVKTLWWWSPKRFFSLCFPASHKLSSSHCVDTTYCASDLRNGSIIMS